MPRVPTHYAPPPLAHSLLVVTHKQERQLLAEGVNTWQQNYFMPGTSDTGVAAWRAWLQKFGAAMPLLPRRLEDLPPLMSRRQALDRYEQHTKHCPDCQKVCCAGERHERVRLCVGTPKHTACLRGAQAAVSMMPMCLQAVQPQLFIMLAIQCYLRFCCCCAAT